MKNSDSAVYYRFASIEALEEWNIKSGYCNAWLFERKNNASDKELQTLQMNAFRKKCEASGYTVIGQTVIDGSSKMTLPTIQKILDQNEDIQYILSPAIRSLSRHTDEVCEAIAYMNEKCVIFKSADDGELMTPKDRMRMNNQMIGEICVSSDTTVENNRADLDDINESDAPRFSM